MYRPDSIVWSRRSVVGALAAVLLAGGVALFAADAPKLSSGWRDRDVRIDGLDEEWRDITQPVKGQHFAVGFLNDADALYFCLVTKDPNTVRQISRMGLMLWLDPAGGKKKTFGVRFPVTYGQVGGNRRQAPPPEPEAGEAPPGGQGMEPAGQRDIQILGPGKNDVRDLENGRSGVTGRYSVRGDLLVYELRVALRKGPDVPFAPDVDPGAALRVELQTPEWRGPVPMRRGGPMIGVGMGRPGGPLYFPGADTSLLKPLDIAAELRLAMPPR